MYCACVPGLAVKCVAHSDLLARHGYGGVCLVGAFIAFGEVSTLWQLCHPEAACGQGKRQIVSFQNVVDIIFISFIVDSTGRLLISGFEAVRLPRQAIHAAEPLRVSISNNHNWPEFYQGNAQACPGPEPLLKPVTYWNCANFQYSVLVP